MSGESNTRFGRVVLAGKPNAGKSTLLNSFLGVKLAIVSPKPQSTLLPVMGLVTDDCCQLLFVDPPGLLKPSSLIQESMVNSAVRAIRDANAVLYLHPVTDGPAPPLESLVPATGREAIPCTTVYSKADLLEEPWEQRQGETSFLVSAKTGEGVRELLEWCRGHAVPGEFRYDPDDVGTQPLRFFVAELVRETAFETLKQELPYSTAALVDEFREGREPVYIRVILYVERESQKGIVIGRDGGTIKAIGASARAKIEELLGKQVYLDLWVKVLSNWRKSPQKLRMFGLSTTPQKGKRRR